MQKTLYRDIPLKSGEILTKGTKVTVKPIPGVDRGCVINNGSRDYKIPYTYVFRKPSDNCLMESVSDGVCSTPAGNRVEPDGHDSDGFPSWLLILGMI